MLRLSYSACVPSHWIDASVNEIRTQAERVMKEFLAPVKNLLPMKVLFKGSFHKRFGRRVDEYGLIAWTARVFVEASKRSYPDYRPGTVTENFIESVAKLSWSEKGPLMAQEFLAKHGIALVVVRHLPRTSLDGCSTISKGRPVIGITLRFDRIDNFWFVLAHKLAHICKHLENSSDVYFDDLESTSGIDDKEEDADRIAREAFIPRNEWVRSVARMRKSVDAITDYARERGIHPAIVAGRIRHDTRNYRILNQLVGHGCVRRLFAP